MTAEPISTVVRSFFTLGRVLTWALLPVSLIVMGCLFSPDRIILHPTTDLLGSIGAVRHTFPFAGGQLEVWVGRSPSLAPGQRPDAYILRFYGNADRADPNAGIEAREWRGLAVEIWGFNYPGYGGSTGPATLDRLGPAALAAYDALRGTAGGRPVVVYGTSIGTTAALHVAAQRPDVAVVALQNPPPLRQIALRQFGWWNLWLIAGPLALRIPSALDSIPNARQVHAPGIFLLSERDGTVLPRYQRLVVDAYAGPKRVFTLAGADHNDPPDPATQAAFYAVVKQLLPPHR